jgi:PST family polysaccharide transporter
MLEPAAGSARSAIIWSYGLTVGRFASTALVIVVMARYLDVEAYGIMALSMVWVTFAQMLTAHGPAHAVIQQSNATDQHFNAAFWFSMAISTALAVVFAASAPLWASANGNHTILAVCWALAPAIVLNGLVVVPDAILRRHLRFKALSLRVLIAGLLSGIAGVILAIAGFGVWALVAQQLILTTFSAAAVWQAVTWRPGWAFDWSAFRDLRKFSVHSLSGFLASFLSARADAILLGVFFGPVAIGAYRFAARFTDTVTSVAVGGLGEVSFPHLSRFSEDREAFAKKLGRVMHLSVLMSFPAFSILAISAEPLLAWIGPQWSIAVRPLQILCVLGMFGAIGTLTGSALQAAGRPAVIAAVGWTMAATTVVTVLIVGATYRSAATTTQVLAMALAYCAIQIVFVVGSALLTFEVVLRMSLGPAMRPAIAALCSPVAIIGAGYGAQQLVAGASPLLTLVVTVLAAGAAAALLLVSFDREVAHVARRVVRRGGTLVGAGRRTSPPQPADGAVD